MLQYISIYMLNVEWSQLQCAGPWGTPREMIERDKQRRDRGEAKEINGVSLHVNCIGLSAEDSREGKRWLHVLSRLQMFAQVKVQLLFILHATDPSSAQPWMGGDGGCEVVIIKTERRSGSPQSGGNVKTQKDGDQKKETVKKLEIIILSEYYYPYYSCL